MSSNRHVALSASLNVAANVDRRSGHEAMPMPRLNVRRVEQADHGPARGDRRCDARGTVDKETIDARRAGTGMD
jgi:hypothetical protein